MGAARADVVGPICESADFLSRDGEVPDAQPGELLAVMDAGAYGFSMASEYNGHPRPAEVLVDCGRASLVRRRQSYDELMAPELL
jgi:diaminopimelate decarboxylase